MVTLEAILLQAGVAGAVLAWFMLRAEKRFDMYEDRILRVEHALDRLTRAQMLTLLARSDVDEPIKDQARAVLAELSVAPGYHGDAPAVGG